MSNDINKLNRINKLKFEHERKRSEVHRHQLEISQLQTELDKLNDEWEHAFKNAASKGIDGIDHFDASGFKRGTDYLYDQINELYSKIGKLENELKDIERELDSLW